MKPTSLSQLAIATVVCMLFSFTTRYTNPTRSSISQNTYYYYFNASDDSYDAYNTVSNEIIRLQGVYGVVVNTTSFGGTLVSRGYTSNIVPHQVWPSSYLYAHF